MVIVRSTGYAGMTRLRTSRVFGRLLAAGVAAVVVATGIGAAGPVAAAPYANVYTVTQSKACGMQGQPDPVGSFVWAVKQANASVGLDKIVLPTGGHLDFSGCFGDAGPMAPFRAQALESVDIVGNNTTLDGYNAWFSPGGYLSPPGQCPAYVGGSVLVSQSGGVLEVGDPSGSPVANVSITGVTMQGLSAIASVLPNSSLAIENSTIRKTQDILSTCHRDPIFVDHGQLVLRGVTWNFTDTPTQNEYSGAIAGVGASIVLDGVDMSFALNGRAINAVGKDSAVYVTSSVISESGGFRTEADPFYFTNSAFYSDLTTAKQRVDAYDGLFYAVASSFHFGGRTLAGAMSQHSPGALWMQWSAVGGPVDSEPLISVQDANRVFLNTNSWIQPTVNQTRNQLLLGVPGIVLGQPGQAGLPTGAVYTAVPPAIYPEPGTSQLPGLLLGFVHDAGPGGVEELRDPLTQAPILTDVFGNPRVSAAGERDLGAMQVSNAPVPSVVGTTATTVTLAWTPDNFGTPSGPWTGWRVQWRPISNSPLPWQELDVTPWATQSTTVPGLTPGTPYEFRVAGIQSPPDPPTVGLYSPPVIGIPQGPIGAPVVTATPGDGVVQLGWTAPDWAGHPAPYSYHVGYRKVGDPVWTPWGTTDQLTIPVNGLVNGQPYEFAVSGLAGDGTSGSDGTATATPVARPTLGYPQPVTWTKGAPLTLPATVGSMVGTPAFQTPDAGLFPPGMTLNASTGAIEGTPTTAGTFGPFTVQVTDGSTSLVGSASVEITILDTAPNPYLSYPDLTATAGVGPVTAAPFLSAPDSTGKTLVYSVVDGPLPGGLSIDPVTGAIAGTPTTPTGGVTSFTIKVCWDTCSPDDNNVVQGVFDVTVLPTMSYPIQANGVAGQPMAPITPTFTAWTRPPVSGTFALMPGSTLPAGLSLNAGTGVISGTPTAAGPATRIDIGYTTGLVDPMTPTEIVSTVLINVRFSIITVTYPPIDGVVGRPITPVTPTVTGASGSKTYALASGALPPGLSLNPATGVISGTPTTAGTWQVQVELRDAFGSGSGTATVTIAQAPTPTPTPTGAPTPKPTATPAPTRPPASGLPRTSTLPPGGTLGGDSWTIGLLAIAGLLAMIVVLGERKRSGQPPGKD